MLSAEDNELLTRTGAGTPMGEFFRRFWLPVLLSQELPERDGAPVRVTVLGEDLIAFRDTEGRAGLLDPRCPHRGANLFFARNEACGLRCAYHGWKFDVEGRCVDMPTMPPESRFRDKVRAGAYPTREWGDVVWTYTREHLGPTDAAIIEFRRLMLRGARGLRAGVEPAAARRGAAYTLRGGSTVADRSIGFADVMVERFGDPVGRCSPPARS